MTLENERHQRAVGQGFFQTARLTEDGILRLRYIYDCGAMRKYAAERDARIDAFISAVGAGSLLDILFLSHVHYDHVSGVERLLASSTGLKVETVVLPLINVADRLIAYARTAVEERGATADDFYRDFVISPADALARFKPRRILFVERGDRDGGAPGSGGPDDGDPDGGPDDEDLFGHDTKLGPSWKLVGRGNVRRNDFRAMMIDGTPPAEITAIIEDTLAFATWSTSTQSEWLLAPFVDPIVASKRHSFLKALAAERKMSVTALERWLQDTSNVSDLVINGLAALASAYEAIEPDFNVTSLCLYSGPRPAAQRHPQAHFVRFGGWHYCDREADRIAWLATGDAALKTKARSQAFKKHYGRLLEEVVTLTLPHHGSDHNHNPEVLAAVSPLFFIAAADQFGKWKHPGPKTLQAVASQGRFVSVVTSEVEAEVHETGKIA